MKAPAILFAILVIAAFLGCSKSRYSGFDPMFVKNAIERERKIPKEDVIAATKKIAVGMTEREVTTLLAPYDVGIGQGRVVGTERVQLTYLIHGILVDMKYDGLKGSDKDKVLQFDVRTFNGW